MPSNTDSRVLIYVQHLLGVGHLQRALLLAAALRDQGVLVKIVSGGLPASLPIPRGVLFEQLAPLYSADASFERLLDAQGTPIDDAWRNARRHSLMTIFNEFAPQALITETFPFGRRMMRFELLPLLEAAHGRCKLVIASIRDILQPRSRPERESETCDWIERYYHGVLVHADPRIARLEDSFGQVARIANKICYSGYISATGDGQAPREDGHNEVLVSAGGSDTGLGILHTALHARPRSACSELRWRLLVSPAIDAAAFAELQRHGDENVIVERNRPDFSELVRRARLSISQAGYNTMVDVLSSNAAAVVIPYAEGREVEQSLRAQALQQRGRVIALAQSALDPKTLASAIEDALKLDCDLRVDLDGAAQSARQVLRWLDDGVAV